MKLFSILISIACLPFHTVSVQQETWITNVHLVDPARKTGQQSIDEEHIADDYGTRGGTAIYQIEKVEITTVYFVK